MSWREAKEDGIPIVKGKESFTECYPPCHICGTPVYSWSYIRGTAYTCPECRKELVRQELAQKKEVGKRAKRDEAIRRISKHSDIGAYDKAIKSVKKCLDHVRWVFSYISESKRLRVLSLIFERK